MSSKYEKVIEKVKRSEVEKHDFEGCQIVTKSQYSHTEDEDLGLP